MGFINRVLMGFNKLERELHPLERGFLDRKSGASDVS